MNLKEVFEKFEDEFLKFDRIESPLNPRPDLCAFLLLDSIIPPKNNYSGKPSDMVCSAEHDEIWLDVCPRDLEKMASEEQIRDLIRCGVRYDDSVESLCMFA